MDTLTHIVLGGCIGEIFVGSKIGKRALILGAVAQSVPDFDFVLSFWYSPSANLLAHRGFTHSFLFIILVTPLLAWLADKWRRPHDVSFKTWCWFFATEMLVHIFLDAFNAYGTGWFEPFNDVRFTFHILFVVDPLFTIVPVIVFFWLLFRRTHRQRTFWSVITIGWCVFYLGVIVDGKSDVKVAKHAERYMYRWLLRRKIRIFEYEENILHAKMATCDNKWVTIGSYNVNDISAYASVELNLEVRNDAFAATVQKKLEEIIAGDCVQVTEDIYMTKYNVFWRFLQYISYWIVRIIYYVFTFYFKQK